MSVVLDAIIIPQNANALANPIILHRPSPFTSGPYRNWTENPAARPVATHTPRPVPRTLVGKDSAEVQSRASQQTQRQTV